MPKIKSFGEKEKQNAFGFQQYKYLIDLDVDNPNVNPISNVVW